MSYGDSVNKHKRVVAPPIQEPVPHHKRTLAQKLGQMVAADQQRQEV